MKTTLLILGMLLFCGGTLFCQEKVVPAQPANPALEKEKGNVEKTPVLAPAEGTTEEENPNESQEAEKPDETGETDKTDKINERLKILEEKLDDHLDKREEIGYIELYTDKVETFKGVSKEIESVFIEINEGAIVTIQVKIKKGGVFSNASTFIELSEINNKRCDKLFAKKEDDYIRICDFLNYLGSRALPDNDTMTLFPDKKQPVYKETGINNIFSARVYSDLLGLVGEESNGLVQSEVCFKSNLHNRNVQNSPFYFGHYISADAGVSRFDNQFRTINKADHLLPPKDTNDVDTVDLDLLDFYQQSFFFANLKINTFEWFINRSYSSIGFNLLGGLNTSRFKDSTNGDVRRINIPSLGFETVMNAKPYHNFGLIASLTYQYMFLYGVSNTAEIADTRWAFRASMEMYWNPPGKLDNRIFARFRYVDTFGISKPFSQFQIGYAVNLSDWMKSKG
ncbi:MAG TPA: hypothetical protein VK151_01775 [Fluviicola sp.]|nr:hypothetical protein [Fluviicola sp.]